MHWRAHRLRVKSYSSHSASDALVLDAERTVVVRGIQDHLLLLYFSHSRAANYGYSGIDLVSPVSKGRVPGLTAPNL